MDITSFLDNVLPEEDRPAQWVVLPPNYAPFKTFQSADGDTWYIPCINMKDKNGKPEGTIVILEIEYD